MIRPHLEYCPQVWAPFGRYGNWSYIMCLESVQRWVTSAIDGMDNLSYRERLEKLDLTTLHERRMRDDLIEVFKALTGRSSSVANLIKQSDRTENLLVKERKKQCTRTMEREFLSSRVVKYWNKLPTKVKRSENVNNFKNNLWEFRKQNYKKNAIWTFLGIIRGYLSKDILKRYSTKYLL